MGPITIVAIMVASLVGLNILLSRMQAKHPERALHRQVLMLVATLIALFFTVIMLPISETLRGQILSLLGILVSATIALSSTTFLGNALAGILLRNVRSFSTGDFIYINEHFGRVSGRSLFHIELQTQDRDLVTLPNLYVTTNPVKVTRASGTIISAEVSLGYDISHTQVEHLLKQAAITASLEDPFVYIIKLGDFSVLYRINGMLKDVKQLLSVRSVLNGAILDSLHGAGIEIVSPNFMNTRDVAHQNFRAQPIATQDSVENTKDPEEIIFDKAENAATLEEQTTSLDEITARIETLQEALEKADDDHQEKISVALSQLQKQQVSLNAKIVANKELIEAE
ncbi:mechanosensitive ion channel domain-containing protein [Desulfuromusa kysingii]|uniref:mechanosensitive ion channel domain-containing protein n=1 Tax=Desulfuromusa kysingii TaxID=37625 RepID=UPI001C313DE0|nr:mechanosensitive ion channel domain-containing protein [Desulfuromusa kysingii]